MRQVFAGAIWPVPKRIVTIGKIDINGKFAVPLMSFWLYLQV